MKLIQILALVAALAVAGAAQSTSTTSQNSGSTSPSSTTGKTASGKKTQNGGTANQPPVKLTVVPKTNQTTAGTKKPAATSSTTAKSTATSKAGAKTQSSKAPVVLVKPVQPATAAKKTSTAAAKKTVPATAKKTAPAVVKKTPAVKAVTKKKKEGAKVVPQKVADNKKDSSGAQTIKSGPAGRRDPFISVIRSAPSGPAGPSCSVGKKCLYIPELMLKGIAKDLDGQMLAVVVSNTHRAYFLRENDQVFNGSVEKITSDTVIFREYATDHLGRETAHEVVKRIPKT